MKPMATRKRRSVMPSIISFQRTPKTPHEWANIACINKPVILDKDEPYVFPQFEKHLPGILVGENKTAGTPNMDVFFEKCDNVVFIESKYTEKSGWKYKDDKHRDGFYLSEAYWGEKGYKSCI